jgi:hypothetical protein
MTWRLSAHIQFQQGNFANADTFQLPIEDFSFRRFDQLPRLALQQGPAPHLKVRQAYKLPLTK